jgi:photosystem II stability/assembly factor-like uncharacterized protein
MQDRVLLLDDLDRTPHIESKLVGSRPQCLAVDPFNSKKVYLATYGSSLLASDDSGTDWTRIGEKAMLADVTSVAVSAIEQNQGNGVVYAGTEPSEIFRSDDGGFRWKKVGDLEKLPSSTSWSFPPRPDTHHVRFIAIDPVKCGLVYAAIEAGALIRTWDGGGQWNDRVKTGPYDSHTLATNRKAPGRIYSAAGDGYFESQDHGDSWERLTTGLRQHYLYCVSVHPNDPDTVLVSASPGPWTAYNPDHAESYVYRKNSGRGWKQVHPDLEHNDSTVCAFTPNPKNDGEFYGANSLGVYHTMDAGETWDKLPINWSDELKKNVWSVALIND